MKRSRLSVRMLFLLIVYLFPAITGIAALRAQESREDLKILIDSEDRERASRLRDLGSTRFEHDYGDFLLLVTDDTPLARDVAKEEGFSLRPDLDELYLNGITVDGQAPELAIERLEETLEPSGDLSERQIFIIQFIGPIADSWLTRLGFLGIVPFEYIPQNAYLAHLTWEQAFDLQRLQRRWPELQMVMPLHPRFRTHPELVAATRRGFAGSMPIRVQLLTTERVEDDLDRLAFLATEFGGSYTSGQYTNVALSVDLKGLRAIAREAAVVSLEPEAQDRLQGERAAQIVAGNVSGANVTGPGYMSWYMSQGFDATQFTSFLVNVVDSASDLSTNSNIAMGRVVFDHEATIFPPGQQDGHGFVNAHILGGLNTQTTFPHVDAAGFNRGLGIAPHVSMGLTYIGTPDPVTQALDPAFNSTAYAPIPGPNGYPINLPWGREAEASLLGARISTNSWASINVHTYGQMARDYDRIVRNAVPSGSGSPQQHTVVFGAGNSGPFSASITSPALAKNVIAVGASENDIPGSGVPGPGSFGPTAADNVNEVLGFSARGPVNPSGGDGRFKPDIMAPGSHVQGGVPQSNYSGLTIEDAYYPLNQTFYGWSTGTSRATPVVAGAAALFYQYRLNDPAVTALPSPALTKAWLLNSAAYLSGAAPGDVLPSDIQGMGRVDLGRAFDAEARIVVDQTQLLTTTGSTHTISGVIANPSEDVRITLAWTDKEGNTLGAPQVNDLDLLVSVGGVTYLGNAFSGPYSSAFGSVDTRNNIESVFLPAGTTGDITVKVRASNIVGDGVPGNTDPTDQDFALVAYNVASGGSTTLVADFTAGTGSPPVSGPAPLAVSFTNLSSPGATGYLWDFGDQTTSTLANPTHVYAAVGFYDVTLTVFSGTASNTVTKNAFVRATDLFDGSFEAQLPGQVPIPPWSTMYNGSGFPTGPVCLVLPESSGPAQDGSFPTDGVLWAELDGSQSFIGTPVVLEQVVTLPPNRTHLQFDAALLSGASGPQVVRYEVDVTVGGSTMTVYSADETTPTPFTSSRRFDATGAALPMTATTSVDVDLTTLFPSIGPGSSFTLRATIEISNGPASYGYIDNIRLAPTVAAADFTADVTSGLWPLLVNFTNLSIGGGITGYSWSFGDGVTSTQANPAHQYMQAGTYMVTLTANSPNPDTETKVGYINVTNPTSGNRYYLSFNAPVTVPCPGTPPPCQMTVDPEDIVVYDTATQIWSMYFDGTAVQLAGNDIDALSVDPASDMVAFSIGSGTWTHPSLSGATSITEHDVVLFTPGGGHTPSNPSGSYTFIFDGSDVGLTTPAHNVDGLDFIVTSPVVVLLSFAGNFTLSPPFQPASQPPFVVEDEDVVAFVSSTLGPTTTGSSSLPWITMYDGSAWGLTAPGDQITALDYDAFNTIWMGQLDPFFGLPATLQRTADLTSAPSLVETLTNNGLAPVGATTPAVDGLHVERF